MGIRKSGVVVASCAVGMVVALAAAAWACTPQARIVGLNPLSAPARSAVVVTGENLAPGKVVEIRWNSLRGETIGSAVADEKGKLEARATIPDAPPGVYSIVALSPGEGLGRAAFQLTAPGAPNVAARDSLNWPTEEGSLKATTGDRPGGANQTLALAGGVLGLGLAALFGGFAVVEVRRRRAPASSERSFRD